MDNRELPTIGVQKMDPKLYKAAMEGDMELLTIILGANESSAPNLTLCLSPQKNTMLHIAVEFGHQTIVEKVIQLCPSLISQHNSKGDTPLHVAARAGHLDLTKLLTPALNLNLTEGNPTLEEGNSVRQAGGVALRMSNLEGSNPVHEALKKSHGEVALYLLAFEERHGLAHDKRLGLVHDVNMAGESLLYLAAEAGLDEVVKKIIEIGDCSTRGPDGQNPLHIAVIKGRLGVVEILLDKESNFITQADRFGNTVLHYASAKSYSTVLEDKDNDRYEERPTVLEDKDNDRYEERRTEEHNQIQILWRLLKDNPSLAYVPNINGDYPLFFAIRNGFEGAIDIILDHCPDSAELVNQTGQNALHLAVMEKNRSIIYRITRRLEFMKLINEPDNDGNTPMHLATRTNHERIVKLLIDGKSVDLTMSNKEGRTAMDICGYTVTKHPIHDMLRESGAVPGRYQWQERFPPPPRPPSSLPPPSTSTSTSTSIPPPRPPRRPQSENSSRSSLSTSPPSSRISPNNSILSPPGMNTVKISREFKKYGLQTLPIVTSLVATVTFAAAFTVPGGYKNDGPREGLPVFMRNAALQAFVLSDILAFCSSMAATLLLIYANAHSKDVSKIHYALKTCYYISWVAILATITTFVTAVYVLTSKESLWLAVTSSVLGFAVPLFLALFLACHRWGLEKKIRWDLTCLGRRNFIWSHEARAN